MLTAFLSMIILYFVLMGWGQVFLSKNDSTDNFLEPIVLGCLVGGGGAILINFFIPVSDKISGVFLLAGAFFWFKHKAYLGMKFQWPLILLFLVASAGLVYAPENFDTGLYHLPQLEWLKQGPTPLGLVNLHSRLSFTPIWFPLAAIVRFPYLELASSFVLNMLLFNCCVLQLYLWSKRGSIAILLSLFSLVYFADLADLYRLSSPSTDVPVALMTVMGITTYFIPGQDRQSGFFFFLLGTLIKPLTFPFLLLHFYLRRPGKGYVLTACVLFVLNCLRSLLLSGCLIYPVNGTCVHNLPWTPSEEKVLADAAFVINRARYPLESVRDSRHWISRWFEEFLQSSLFSSMVFMLLVLIVSLVIYRRHLLKTWPGEMKLLYGMTVMGFVAWFLSVPYIRMGLFYLIFVPLFPFMVCLREFVPKKNLRTTLLALICFFYSKNLTVKFDAAALTAKWPVIPKQKIEENFNSWGSIIYRPKQGIKCWDLPLPCTTHFDPAVKYEKVWGRYLFKKVNLP